MKIIILNLLLTFSFCFSQGQKVNPKITYDYLSGFENWKLILNSDNTFIFTTNQLFRPDTSVRGAGTFLRTDTSLQFYCDTATVNEKHLFKTTYSNEQAIVQSGKLVAKNQIVDFKNVMRLVYDTSKFSENIQATYYRGDGKGAFFVTLLSDRTYKISESVHGNDEHTEVGKWDIKNEKIIFKHSGKYSSRLDEFGGPKAFYFTDNFLVGKKKISQKEETYYYFTKIPLDWY